MNKRAWSIFAIFIWFVSSVTGQVAMGKWRTHFAYNQVKQLTLSENKIFVLSDISLYSIDKRDKNIELYSKVNGLSGTMVAKIGYDETNKMLLITYGDGNIDFMSSNGIKNLPDFYNKQLNINKSVNHILFHDNKAYLSMNFGIMVLSMRKTEIQDTYYIGDLASEVKVLNTTIHNGNLLAISESDIYYAPATSPTLINYETWKKMAYLPGSGSLQAAHHFDSHLVLLRDGKLYVQDASGTWSNVDEGQSYVSISVTGEYLLAHTGSVSFLFDKHLTKTPISNLTNLTDGVFDPTSKFLWLGGDVKGVAEYNIQNAVPTGNFYQPNGPAVNAPYKLKFAGQRLFMLQGARWAIQYDKPGIIMIFENNQWKTIPPLTDIPMISSPRDFVDIGIDPNDPTHFYVASYGHGIFEYKNDAFYNWYNMTNSTIETIYPTDPRYTYHYMRMGAGIYDKEGNIWFTNSKVSSGVKILKKNGEWGELSPNAVTGETLGEILILKQNPNIKWVLSLRAGAFIAFDDNGTLDSFDDDRYIVHKNFPDPDGGQALSSDNIYCIAQDKNGAVWIGTNSGPFIFTNPQKVFDSDFTITRVKIPRNDGTNLADYLLKEERVNAIAIDGANRKWIGTQNSGVYLLSENGQETVYHFTTQNSPMLSNTVLAIDINPTSGEVFFGTNSGLISFQSDAATADEVFGDVHVYPNPVRENHTGIITITGLVEKTHVKITDVAGNLVAETTSNGSIATWDGKNKFGQKVSTGVYLAICLSPDGQQSKTSKILVIN